MGMGVLFRRGFCFSGVWRTVRCTIHKFATLAKAAGLDAWHPRDDFYSLFCGFGRRPSIINSCRIGGLH
jgi:hypothetical protein